jgi:hypothetical protein
MYYTDISHFILGMFFGIIISYLISLITTDKNLTYDTFPKTQPQTQTLPQILPQTLPQILPQNSQKNTSDILKKLYDKINCTPEYANWKFKPIDSIVLTFNDNFDINFVDLALSPSTIQPEIYRILAYIPKTQQFFIRNAYKYHFGTGSIDLSTKIKQMTLEEIFTVLCV